MSSSLDHATGRDLIWSLALRVAKNRYERGWLREFSPETISHVADEHEFEISDRTIRRVLDSMAETGVLEDVGSSENREYRLCSWILATDVSPDTGSSHPSTDLSSSSRDFSDISVDSTPASDRRRPIDKSVTGPTSPFSDQRIIYHLFADTGVESEPLSAYGRVIRVGLDPRKNRFSSLVRADATAPPLRDRADLAVLHPPCQRWSTATRITGTQQDHPDLLDQSREIADELADHWIIENVPEAPLEDPIVLTGSMFGLPVPYKRAFETSFDVPEPPKQPTVDSYSEPFEKPDGSLGLFRGEKDYWRTIKQVTGDYPSKPLKNSGIPAPYIHYLAHWWLRSLEEQRRDI